MPTLTQAVALGGVLGLFVATYILYEYTDWISYSDVAGICAITTTGVLIWAATIGVWWGVLLTGVSLVPLTWTWWTERTPEDQK